MTTHRLSEASSPPPPAWDVAVALGHLAVAAGALAAGAVLVVAGTRPGAELEALYSPIGWGLLLAALVFGSVAVTIVRVATHQVSRAARLSRALGLVEVVVAGVGVAGAAFSIASYPEFAPWRSPTLVPAVALGALGITAVVRSRRARREA